jgi:hypothetical protein
VYQKREFALLLSFCEEYAVRHAYDRSRVDDDEEGEEKKGTEAPEADLLVYAPRRQTRQARKRPRSKESASSGEAEGPEFTVEKLISLRVVGRDAVQQVLVQWEGYRRPTWEPYNSIQEQLPELLTELEANMKVTKRSEGREDGGVNDSTLRDFLNRFIVEHHMDQRFRWVPDRLNQLEHAAACCVPPIHETADQAIVDIVRSTVDEPSPSSSHAVLGA